MNERRAGPRVGLAATLCSWGRPSVPVEAATGLGGGGGAAGAAAGAGAAAWGLGGGGHVMAPLFVTSAPRTTSSSGLIVNAFPPPSRFNRWTRLLPYSWLAVVASRDGMSV